ncbi:PREDICTED: helicase ARIP4 isoform X1 [Crocodylus porosus]|uniref:helicase ARIP4 isoform X1 n=1 Tax=Crocodylus porosus TaxID=8502 RepID=UPI00093E4261|nr:PREDICTED: helicase ARIP4 isoform X1 [Crocodylus porosus]XP_019392643.1 PREDICTED: helicase ARIP4 isoform X1 [Crocodylus porosus]
MSDESISGSDPDLDPDLEQEDMEEEEEEDEEEAMEEENDGDDEEDLLDENDQPQEAVFSNDHVQHNEDGEWKRSTSTTSSQSKRAERLLQNQHKGLASEDTKKKRAQKPSHMRRNIRKLLREDQLEAVTKAAQQEELERRKRLEQQRKDYPTSIPTVPLEFLSEEIVLRTAEATQLPPQVLAEEVICLDSSSSGSEDDTKGKNSTKDEVIELSSGEDDALQIVDSSDSANEGEDDGTEESSGAHVNDALNQSDALGQVIININHPPNEEDIFLAPQLARAVKPHQIGGIRFLYDNLVESLERFKTSSGFGCILAHSMGLGKTIQVISFLDVLFRHTEAKTVLAIVPVNTLQNWLAEFNMWLPAPDTLPADYNPEEIQPRTFKVHILNDEHKTTAARAKVVNDWVTEGGVLLMGYEMYRLLSLKKSFATGRKKKTKKQAGPVIIDLDEEDRQQELLKGIEKALSRPGPDVVICDEGHRIKNCHASTSQALKNIRSRRRVVLTGYPLQNNLIEYWCMVDFVRPDFLGTRQEFSNMFERPILNGQCIDSTPQDVRLMRYRSHVLHSLLEGFVQRRGHNVLKIQLPSKEEHVILVRLSKIQRALYTEFMNRFRDAGNSGWLGLNPLKAFCVCCKIWNHPDVLYEALQKENLANEQDLDVDDLGTASTNSRCQPQGMKIKTESNASPIGEATNSKFIQSVGFNPFQERANQVVTYEWAKDILCDYQTGVLENSPKMVLLFHLVEESVKLGDKILVFSQSLSTLSVIEEFLAKRQMPNPAGSDGGVHNWIRNINYYRLDGSTSASERERLINQFNDPSNSSVWLFLLSTRAGCLGVNLIGANRVVVFDASWNPCHDAQAVCRVYRYGQKKPCHIYRLVSDYTLEKKIYDRQISKQGMSDRVVDDLNPVLNFTRREVENLLHFVEEESDPAQLSVNKNKIKESVLQLACLKHPHLITKEPFQHESLLIDRKEHKLTKAEKKAAKKSYEEEKRASVPYTRPSYAQYYPASDQSLTSIPAFSQRNWRPAHKGEDKPVASVRPVQSTPIPMMPRHVSMVGSTSGSNPAVNFPINYLQRAGVLVQKIVTTTDIVIPGTNTSTDVQARISAGESIHIIRGTKGTYIRTSDGRIFAIRTTGKPKSNEDHRAAASGSQGPSLESTSNGRHSASSPKLPNTEELTRPISPDSPEIISELQQYAEAAAARESRHSSPSTNAVQGHPARTDSLAPLAARGAEQRSGIHCLAPSGSSALPAASQHVDGHAVLDLRGNKRKSTSPSAPEEHARRQQKKRQLPTAVQPLEHGYPVSGGFTMPPVSLNHNLTHPFVPQAGNSLYMGTGSSYYQLPNFLSDPHLVFPVTTDPLLTAGTASSSAATSATASVPPFMLNPSVTGMLPNYSLPFTQSLLPEPRMFAPFPAPVLPGGLSRSMASAYPGYMSPQSGYPAGGLLRSQVPQFESQEVPEVGCSSNDEDKDDDVIEITGK